MPNPKKPDPEKSRRVDASSTRVFVRSELHAALGDIADKLLATKVPMSDAELSKAVHQIKELEEEISFLTARVSHAYTALSHAYELKNQHEVALQWLHKSRVVLSMCYEEKGKFLPHHIRKAYENVEDRLKQAVASEAMTLIRTGRH
ncbi:hypothetical protein BSKO_11348 [Bryopsis sp. KO-2023]|nr:hypothetical protein BSKO_11348 [Bryopsis sp. KO-2023]